MVHREDEALSLDYLIFSALFDKRNVRVSTTTVGLFSNKDMAVIKGKGVVSVAAEANSSQNPKNIGHHGPLFPNGPSNGGIGELVGLNTAWVWKPKTHGPRVNLQHKAQSTTVDESNGSGNTGISLNNPRAGFYAYNKIGLKGTQPDDSKASFCDIFEGESLNSKIASKRKGANFEENRLQCKASMRVYCNTIDEEFELVWIAKDCKKRDGKGFAAGGSMIKGGVELCKGSWVASKNSDRALSIPNTMMGTFGETSTPYPKIATSIVMESATFVDTVDMVT